jgi:glycosyltransferase involved in cell wall biosynthesis
VLFITGEFPPVSGGVGDYTDRLAHALTTCGHDIAVETHILPDSLAARNIDVQWAADHPEAIWREIARWDLRAWRAIARRIRDIRPDVVHLQWQAAAFGVRTSAYLYPTLLRTWNIRPLSVVTFHDLLPPHLFPLSGKLGMDRRAMRWLTRGADGVVVTNAADASQVRQWKPRYQEEIPIGSNMAVAPPAGFDRTAWRSKLGVGASDPLIAYFGFSNQSKGVESLLAAFAQLSSRMPAARLLMIGGGTGNTDTTNRAIAGQLHIQASALGLETKVNWTGFQDAASVSANLLSADVLALPYRDGVSLRRGTLMAGLAHGCAIVTTRPPEPPPPDLDSAVLLYDGATADQLTAALTSALQPDTQQRLRAAASTYAQQFSWDRIASRHTALYITLCFPR